MLVRINYKNARRFNYLKLTGGVEANGESTALKITEAPL